MAEEEKNITSEDENTTSEEDKKVDENPQPSDEEGKDTNENEDGEDKKDDEEKKEDEVDPKDVNLENPNEVSEALDKKGIDYAALTEEYMSKGELSEKTFEMLEAAGIPKDMVHDYIEGYKARVEVELNELGAVVGGRDKLEEIKNWAANNLSKERILSLNAIRDKAELELVLIGLKASMEDKEGKNPEYQKGTGEGKAIAGYRSQAEMFEAIKDPKYQKDPAYRADVQKKITASREAGIDLGIY